MRYFICAPRVRITRLGQGYSLCGACDRDTGPLFIYRIRSVLQLWGSMLECSAFIQSGLWPKCYTSNPGCTDTLCCERGTAAYVCATLYLESWPWSLI